MVSWVVPKLISLTEPALPSFSPLSSLKRGTMRPLVAMATSSISGPPTQRTAGSSFCSSKWLGSSSNPHWHSTRLAPVSFTCCTSVNHRRVSKTQKQKKQKRQGGRGAATGRSRDTRRNGVSVNKSYEFNKRRISPHSSYTRRCKLKHSKHLHTHTRNIHRERERATAPA